MNKILVTNNKKILVLDQKHYDFNEDGIYFVEVNNTLKEVSFSIFENANVVLNLLGNKANLKFRIKICGNSSLVINSFIIDSCIDIKTLLEDKKANFSLYNSVLSNCDSFNKIEVKHLESNTNSLLKNHGFSLNKAKVSFDVASFVFREACECIVKQDNKIIQNENSLSQINPKLYIDNYDVEASHSAYVGEFKEDELFYLMSRGIDLGNAKFLLLKSFLVGSMPLDDDMMQEFYNCIVKYFNREV